MIWQPARLACLSNIFWGCDSPSMLQWYTAVSVTKATVFTDIHFQKITSSAIVWAFILLFISMLKIWSVFPASMTKSKKHHRSITTMAILQFSYLQAPSLTHYSSGVTDRVSVLSHLSLLQYLTLNRIPSPPPTPVPSQNQKNSLLTDSHTDIPTTDKHGHFN